MNRLSDDLIALTSMLMLANEQGERLRLTNEFNACIGKLIEEENRINSLPGIPKEKTTSAILKFTTKEISKMEKTFKKEFIANGLVAHITKRPSGKEGIYYEIRYRRNGYDITASSTDLKEAKRKFLEKTTPKEINKYKAKEKKKDIIALMFDTIAQEWFTFKEGTICKETLHSYKSLYERFIYPPLGNRSIKDIRTIDLSLIMKQFAERPRMYEDTRTVLSSIFRYAISSGIIQYNPLALIPYKRAERTIGRALTKEELSTLLKALETPKYAPYKQSIFAMLYFGLRPCELDETARFEDGFLIARNRKRHGGKVEYKKIPVSSRIQGKIDLTKPIKPSVSWDTLNRVFKSIFNSKEIRLYYLRHTFSTWCQMYVRQEIVNIWLGDAPDKLIGRHYTHFPDYFMKSEMEKVIFEV